MASGGGKYKVSVPAARKLGVLDVACPYCKSEPYVPCMTPSGEPKDSFHADRKKAV